MAHETIAPWAEKVPGASPMTADELLRMPDDAAWKHELVDGVLVRMSAPGFRHGKLAVRLARVLGNYVDQHALGDVVGDAGFLLSRPGQPDTVLGPDVAYVRAEHAPMPDAPGSEKYLRIAPDLAAEIVSPDQYKPEMAAKARTYLQAGVRLVWVIWPETKTADVWRHGSDQPITTLTISDTLDDLDVVPGFSYPLADLFG